MSGSADGLLNVTLSWPVHVLPVASLVRETVYVGDAGVRVGLARRFYNDAVRDTRALRRRRELPARRPPRCARRARRPPGWSDGWRG